MRTYVQDRLAKAPLLLGVVILISGHATAVTPTQSQIDQLMALPEAQRSALARQYGIQLPASGNQISTGKKFTEVEVVRPISNGGGWGQQPGSQGWYGSTQAQPPLNYAPQTNYNYYGSGYSATGYPYPQLQGAPSGSGTYTQSPTQPYAQQPYSYSYPGNAPYGGSPETNGYLPPPGAQLSLVAPMASSPNPQMGPGFANGVSQPAGGQPMGLPDPSGGGMQYGIPPYGTGVPVSALTPGLPVLSGFEMPLRPFGYDLFAAQPTTFAPVTEIPVPSDYTMGPGDTVKIQLFGKENRNYELQINREGVLQIPELGPLSVAGMSFDNLKTYISKRVVEKYIGVESSVSLGELRSIRIFVLGESRTPGSYSVSSLSTITNALYVSGGVLETGSLRHIQLKRGGVVVAELDLYDLLLQGDTGKDMRLQAGDAVFIPPVGDTAAVKGKVRRPAIYELKKERSVGQLITLAGGLLPEANPAATKITRVKLRQNTAVVDVDLSTPESLQLPIKNGDIVNISGVNELAEGFVGLYGEVARPGFYAWKEGMRLSDLIPSLRLDLKPGADLNYALIVREINAKREIRTYVVSLADALSDPIGASNIELHELDKILVFMRGAPRDGLLQPILMKLAQQAKPGEAQRIIEITGEVPFPGYYPLPENQSPQNVLLAAGGLGDAVYTLNTEVARFQPGEDGGVKTEILNLNLDRLLKGEESFLFRGRDQVLLKRLPDYALRMQVKIEGEVRFPGVYTVTRGETLSDLLGRAGGLTNAAFPEGAVFTRIKLAEIEAQRLVEAEQRLQKDLSAIQLEAANAQKPGSQDAETLEALLEDVRSSRPLGRLVVDLPSLLSGRMEQNVVLQDGDTLKIPQASQSVSVIGEVQFATSHIFEETLTVKDYITRSGGETYLADSTRIYVVRANGSVWLPDSSGWFAGDESRLHKGDTIVVPMETDRINKLQLWTNVSQIMYQIALGAAAVGSL